MGYEVIPHYFLERLILLKRFTVFCLLLLSATSYGLDISGQYRCTGEDFLNKTTFDEPTTVEKKGDTYLFKWLNKGIWFHGSAILLNNTIAAIFWSPTFPNITPGVVTYQVLPNGDLKGKWTVRDGKVTGNEYCVKLKS